MPFDFNSGKNPPRPSSGSSGRGPSSYGSIPRPDSSQSSGFTDIPKPSSDNRTRAKGFDNHPTPITNDSSNPIASSPQRNVPRRTNPRQPVIRNTPNLSALPWSKILIAIAIIVAVVLVIIFRQEILEFITQLAAGLLLIVILIFVLKGMLFKK